MSQRAFLFLQAGRLVYRCQLTKSLTLIGSAADNDIVVKDASVRPHHAQITCAGTEYTVRPRDGEVRVDDTPVETALELASGCRIGIGEIDVLFAREQPRSPVTVHLVVHRPGMAPLGIWTARSTIVIGRQRGDLMIEDPEMSPVHAIIENFCEGGQFLLDARSEGGTELNGEAIQARNRLLDGDEIGVGDTRIQFWASAVGVPEGEEVARIQAELVKRQSDRAPGRSAPAPRNPYQRYASEVGAAPPRRKRSMDLASGLHTGIVDTRDVERSRSSLRTRSRAPAEPVPARPRPPGRGFGSRPEEAGTTVAQTAERTADERWYLPTSGPQRSTAGRPIIRPRGDRVPGEAGMAARRPPPAPIPPMADRDLTPPSRIREPVRLRPQPVVVPGASSVTAPRPSPAPTRGAAAPAPRDGDHWYHPASESRAPPPRQAPAQPPASRRFDDRRWYLPDKGERRRSPYEDDDRE